MSDDRELDRLDNVRLASGAHGDWQQGACLMEAVAYVAGEEHSDRPVCASTVLGTFGRNLNDVLPDDLRQHLKPLVPLLIGTAGDGHDEARSYLALDWLIRTYLPTWLELAHLNRHVEALRGLVPIVDMGTASAAGPVVHIACRAARDAARDAARAAARDAAWAAAGAAAGDAAGAAAGDAAWDAAGDAAGVAAGDAAGDALTPTVRELQLSAIELFGRMITVGSTNESAVEPLHLVAATRLVP